MDCRPDGSFKHSTATGGGGGGGGGRIAKNTATFTADVYVSFAVHGLNVRKSPRV